MLVAGVVSTALFLAAASWLTKLGWNWRLGWWALAGNFVVVAGAVFGVLYLSVQRQYGPIRRFRTRVGEGRCLHCGYDLRGSTGRCPECGRAIDEAIYRAMGSVRSTGRK